MQSLIVSYGLTLICDFQLFADEWDSMKPMYNGCMDNRRNWQQMADDVEKGNFIQLLFDTL